MHLTRLALTNFRCFRELAIALPRGTVVVAGGNAAGKSSLLEAVYVLATTRAAHASSERELIHWDAGSESQPYARVEGDVERGGTADRIEVLAMLQGSGSEQRLVKQVRVNRTPRRAIEAIGLLNVVLFAPRDLSLVDGGPAQRRRFLDVLGCQIDGAYCRALSRYNQTMAQRNHLLRRLGERGDREQLTFWDDRLAADGGVVIGRRAGIVAQLQELAGAVHSELTPADAPLQVRYRSSLSGVPERAASEPEERLARALASSRDRDLARGVTSVGPHRDDLALSVGGVDLRVFGSRGQQRTAALALKLAESALMQRETGHHPVLLLDDVLSELDARRRALVLSRLAPEQQTFLTATEIEPELEALPSLALVLQVEGGRLQAANG